MIRSQLSVNIHYLIRGLLVTKVPLIHLSRDLTRKTQDMNHIDSIYDSRTKSHSLNSLTNLMTSFITNFDSIISLDMNHNESIDSIYDSGIQYLPTHRSHNNSFTHRFHSKMFLTMNQDTAIDKNMTPRLVYSSDSMRFYAFDSASLLPFLFGTYISVSTNNIEQIESCINIHTYLHTQYTLRDGRRNHEL